MTECEALQESVRRWGRNAHVRYRQGRMLEGMEPYAVGQWLGHVFEQHGQGQSWEEAFQNCEKKP